MDEGIRTTAAGWWLRVEADPADPGLAGELEAWLQMDLRHRLAYAEIAVVAHSLDGMDAAQVQDRKPVCAARSAQARPGQRLGSGLAVALVLVCAVLWLPDLIDHWRADRYTAVGEIRSEVLDDGSVLTLDSDSAVIVELGGTQREVRLLRGGMHIEVAPDPQRPLAVRSAQVDVTALGTAFSVATAPARVVVDHGRVRLAQAEGNRPQGMPETLGAGEQIVQGEAGWAHTGVPPVPPDWLRHQRIHEGVPLRAVIDDLDRYLAGRIWLRGHTGIWEAPVSAVLDLRDPVRALRALAAAQGLQVHHPLPGLWVIQAP